MVEVGVEVEVEFEVGVEVGVVAEVKVRAQNYFFGVGGWLEKWRIRPIFQLEVGAWQLMAASCAELGNIGQ